MLKDLTSHTGHEGIQLAVDVREHVDLGESTSYEFTFKTPSIVEDGVQQIFVGVLGKVDILQI